MKTYEFTIVATGLDPQAEDFEARFYGAGCDDALVSFQKGHILVDFSREASSLAEAVVSAVEHCLEAGATVEHIEPDPLVSLADIAARSNLTRAAVTNYYKGYRSKGFPAPKAKVTTNSPLWDWSEVSVWLHKHRRVRREVAVGAAVFSAANDLLDRGVQDFGSALRNRVAQKLEAL